MRNHLFLILVSGIDMAFFTSAIGILKTLVVAVGAGLAVWGVINLLEGYGNDNRATWIYVNTLDKKSRKIMLLF